MEKVSSTTSSFSSSSFSSDSSSDSEGSSNQAVSESETSEEGGGDGGDAADSDDPDRAAYLAGQKFTADELMMGSCIMQDLRVCQQDDPYLFCFLLPFICSSYILPNYMINNSELVYLLVSCIDPRQMRDLRSSILCEDLILFKEPPNASQVDSKNKAKTAKTKKNSAIFQGSRKLYTIFR